MTCTNEKHTCDTCHYEHGLAGQAPCDECTHINAWPCHYLPKRVFIPLPPMALRKLGLTGSIAKWRTIEILVRERDSSMKGIEEFMKAIELDVWGNCPLCKAYSPSEQECKNRYPEWEACDRCPLREPGYICCGEFERFRKTWVQYEREGRDLQDDEVHQTLLSLARAMLHELRQLDLHEELDTVEAYHD